MFFAQACEALSQKQYTKSQQRFKFPALNSGQDGVRRCMFHWNLKMKSSYRRTPLLAMWASAIRCVPTRQCIPIVCFPIPKTFLPLRMQMALVISSFFILQLLSAYRRVVKYLVNSNPCVKHDGCVTNCVNATCFLTNWSVLMLIAQSTTSCIGSSAAGIKLPTFLISMLNRTPALHRHSS